MLIMPDRGETYLQRKEFTTNILQKRCQNLGRLIRAIPRESLRPRAVVFGCLTDREAAYH